MSIKVMSRVWEGSRQSGGALLVLLAIADFADDDGLAFPSVRTLARKARLSERQVQRVLAELPAAGELVVRPGAGRQGAHLFRVTGGPPTPAPRHNVTRTVTPGTVRNRQHPPAPRRRPGAAAGGGRDGRRARLLCPGPAGTTPVAGPAVELAAALYRGLAGDLGALTGPVRRRELAIAAQLLAVGATPTEAEAYARDMAARGNRLAPIDLRSLERERSGWLARRRGANPAARRYVDRTGQGVADPAPGPPPPGDAERSPPETMAPDRAWLRAVQARLEGTADAR
jgi:hypothetical protein